MTSQDILEALQYLHEHGMPDSQLNRLHHKKSAESFGRALKYWTEKADKGSEPRDGSLEYGERLRYVMSMHKDGKQDFAKLVSEAWDRSQIKPA
jgi:hypothetical protein